jgi:LytS/YehU family sensor histidine kinase
MKVPSRAYWMCQAVGWSLYGAVNVGLFLTAAEAKLALAAAVSCTVVLGALYSHLYRRVIRRRGWLQLGPLALLPRVLVASLVLGACLEATGTLLTWLILPRAMWGWSSAAMAILLFNYSVVYFGWQLIYFGWHLFERSRRLEVERWQLQATAQEAELRYLKTQINPHFLFNCLNGLRSMIAEDTAAAQAMVTRLASLLRYALGTAHDQLVPLERELAVVEDYLALERARLESRLRARFAVAAECRPMLVPPMIVQMLVENGIKHGVAQRTDGGEIAVEAHMEGNDLEVVVVNTAASGPTSAESGGIGLANARDRLQLLYGGRAELRLDRSDGHTTASLRIPCL